MKRFMLIINNYVVCPKFTHEVILIVITAVTKMFRSLILSPTNLYDGVLLREELDGVARLLLLLLCLHLEFIIFTGIYVRSMIISYMYG